MGDERRLLVRDLYILSPYITPTNVKRKPPNIIYIFPGPNAGGKRQYYTELDLKNGPK